MPVNRRGLAAAALLAAGALALPRLLVGRGGDLPDARPLPGVPGFRYLETGAVSVPAALIGLEPAPLSPEDAAEIARVRDDPAAALFGAVPAGLVPLAMFTDVNCPNCKGLSEILSRWQREARPGLAIRWHELPLLGPTSEAAARAALAAGLQGGYLAMHDRLISGRGRPTPAFLTAIARDQGLDPARLMTDMTGEAVAARLRTTRALAHVLGIPGTPALVIDRLLVIGALPEPLLDRLVRAAGTRP